MDRKNFRWLFPWSHARRHTQDAAATLFRGLRIRLTLWYCGVLCAALLVFGVSLYVGAQYWLMKPIQDDTQNHAQDHASQWQHSSASQACPLSAQPGQKNNDYNPFGQYMEANMHNQFAPEMIICFDQNGKLLIKQNTTGLPTILLDNHLARQALASPSCAASAIVNAGSSSGNIYLYAEVIKNNQQEPVGVVIAGEYTEAQDNALSSLLTLLWSIGSGALLAAGFGGLFLANRALEPAHQAWNNQQRFIADASHELRTPLTLLRADAEVLLRGRTRLDEEDASLLEDIVIETNHMTTITTNLLTLARLDNTGIHREHEVMDLAMLAEENIRRVQALANERAIHIEQDLHAHPHVIGDPTLLEEALLVFLSNAIKYNKDGGEISVQTAIQNKQAILEIRDTGIGIAQEHLPHLGQRFYRVDKARSRETGGTGLGLSIAQSIINEHNGQLYLSSKPGQGTTVKMLLPLV